MRELIYIRLRNVDDIAEYVERPINSDGAPSLHNAYLFWCSDRGLDTNSVEPDPVFANTELKQYAYAVSEAAQDDYSWFDMNRTEDNRYGEDGQDTHYGKKRSPDNLYLKAAQFIRDSDRSLFTFERADTDSFRAIRVTNRETGKTFDFLDVYDWSMYFVMRQEMERVHTENTKVDIAAQLSDFIGQ